MFGMIQLKNNVLKFRSGWKYVNLKPKIKKWGNNISYKGNLFPIDVANYKPLLFTFEENDIAFESLRKIEITNCRILSKTIIGCSNNPTYYFDLLMNPYPVIDVSEKRKPVEIQFLIDPLKCIKITRKKDTSDTIENIEIYGESPLTPQLISHKFQLIKSQWADIYFLNTIDLIKRNNWPIARAQWLNKIHFNRFKQFAIKVNPQIDLDKITLMNVIDINDIDEVISQGVLSSRGNDKMDFSNCEIWEICKDRIIVEKGIRLNEYQMYGDKNKYMVLRNTLFDKDLKELVSAEYSFCPLYLLQVNKNSLDLFLKRNFMRRISQ